MQVENHLPYEDATQAALMGVTMAGSAKMSSPAIGRQPLRNM